LLTRSLSQGIKRIVGTSSWKTDDHGKLRTMSRPKKIKTVSVPSKRSLLDTPVVIWTREEEETADRAMQLFRNHGE
jgi:hypothetical protein